MYEMVRSSRFCGDRSNSKENPNPQPNSQPNPQNAVSCAILNDLGGPWQSPRSCKLSVTAEVASSSLVVPAISFQELAESAPFSRGHKKAQNRYRK
jgi:hypothetical protein